MRGLFCIFNVQSQVAFQANCPHGCPCLNYDCDNSEPDDDNSINGPIAIENFKLTSELEYSDNFNVSFEYKASTVPSNQNWHQIIIGKIEHIYAYGSFNHLKLISIIVKHRLTVIQELRCSVCITDYIILILLYGLAKKIIALPRNSLPINGTK